MVNSLSEVARVSRWAHKKLGTGLRLHDLDHLGLGLEDIVRV